MNDRRLQSWAGAGAVISALLLAAIAGWSSGGTEHSCVSVGVKFYVSGICEVNR
jgi:hypothetical protein